MYKDKRWWNSDPENPGLSQIHRKLNPICVECDKHGVTTAVEEVDHIKPHDGDWSLFLDPENLQSLCSRCHAVKTRRENSN